VKSIRRQLTGAIAAATIISLVAGGLILYLALREALYARFDSELATKAQALAKASELDDLEFEIDLNVREFAGFGAPGLGDFFVIRDKDGAVLERSPSLGFADLPDFAASTGADTGFTAIVLPDGAPGRAYWKTFQPLEDDPDKRIGQPYRDALERYRDLRIVVASDISGLYATLRTAALIIAAVAAGGLLVTLAILHRVVSAAFRPFDLVSSEVQQIDVRRLDRRLPVEGLPLELRGMAAKLNELLGRLEASFARERRFTSDAAHELRTPLAELKAMAELGARWPAEFTAGQGAEMGRAIAELEALLEKLSQLARADAAVGVQRESVDLAALIGECLARFEADIAAKELQVDLRASGGAWQTDPVLWRAIVTNLIGNSVAYAPEGTTLVVHASPREFSVTNEAPDLQPGDLEYLFDRFWRKSSARTDRAHSGLGLSVVKASVELLGGSCHAALDAGRLTVSAVWKT
jgi:signal transduction histidine kinase